MKHKVLILGTLGEFTELVKKAKEKGYETVVCDGYADGIARTYADKAYTIPYELAYQKVDNGYLQQLLVV